MLLLGSTVARHAYLIWTAWFESLFAFLCWSFHVLSFRSFFFSFSLLFCFVFVYSLVFSFFLPFLCFCCTHQFLSCFVLLCKHFSRARALHSMDFGTKVGSLGSPKMVSKFNDAVHCAAIYIGFSRARAHIAWIDVGSPKILTTALSHV